MKSLCIVMSEEPPSYEIWGFSLRDQKSVLRGELQA